jgi:hypothetical protein
MDRLSELKLRLGNEAAAPTEQARDIGQQGRPEVKFCGFVPRGEHDATEDSVHVACRRSD